MRLTRAKWRRGAIVLGDCILGAPLRAAMGSGEEAAGLAHAAMGSRVVRFPRAKVRDYWFL